MRLKDISRTATFAWDLSSSSSPLLVTGAVAGALDESFSNESQLEIWAPKFIEKDGDRPQGFSLGGQGSSPEGSVTVPSRFNRLAWSQPSANSNGQGLIAAGMETGEVYLFDPAKILAGGDPHVFKSDKHTGPVRGLDFNPLQTNLLLSGATSAELYIHDLNNLTAPIPPGPVSTKLNEITALQWNTTVPRIFAASSSSGFTSVWDLRASKEIASLQYGGGAAKGDVVGGIAGLQIGKRRGMSDVCWHPDQITRLVTSSEDDESPIIMLWDLRNTRAPERILSGHTKGVLSVSWCKQDADLLLSCGKDNRTIVWNPQSGDIVGELPATGDWAFQTSWCPRNPDILATASFDGHIGIHSLQATQLDRPATRPIAETASAEDVFRALGDADSIDDGVNVKSLTQAPKWLKRPVSATFGYGGLLASISNLPGASGKHQSGVVHLRNIVTEESIIDRAEALNDILGDKEKLAAFSSEKSGSDTAWKALQTLFQANSRDELVALLGFSKEDVARQVEETIKKISANDGADDHAAPKSATPPEEILKSPETIDHAKPPVSETSSLFDDGPGTPVTADADFFSSMASGTLRNPQLDAVIPHLNPGADSSVAATQGSGASSLRSEAIKANTFHIYPPDESDIDRLITQALVLGDFTSAVDLCLASDRFADALILAVRGGSELLQSTQKAYFARRTVSHPFLRVFQSIVTEDLVDIVQNADLGEWRVVFVVLCTFARESDFSNLADQLGRRLQYRWHLLTNSDSPEAKESAKVARQDATLCYLAARNLERIVSIWIDEMREEESITSAPRYSAHAHALQSFIEKVAVFQAATGYVDKDLISTTSTEAGVRAYPLAGLYDRYYEYADLLATQGLVEVAAKYVQMTPSDYDGSGGIQLDKARERVFAAAGLTESLKTRNVPYDQPVKTGGNVSSLASYTASASPYAGSYAPQTSSIAQTGASFAQPLSGAYAQPALSTLPSATLGHPAPQQNVYAPPPGSAGSLSTAQPVSYGSYQPTLYAPSNGFSPSDTQSQGYSSHPYQPAYGATTLPPPPRVNGQTGEPQIPASQRRDMPGWNDAPSLAPPKRPTSTARETPKPAPIMSPFPMSTEPAGSGFPTGFVSPPPRQQPNVLPPPPKGGPRPPSVQTHTTPNVVNVPPPQPAAHLAPPSQLGPSNQFVSPTQYAVPPVQTAPPISSAPPHVRPPPPRGMVRAGPPPPGVIAGPPPRALSPLGPGATRPPQPSLNSRVATSPAQAPPTGQRVAGPPPPGRGPVPGQSFPAPTPSPPTVVPQASLRPTHPAGDRSHIPEKSRPIYEGLINELSRIKRVDLPVHLNKIVDDTERRLNILFDGLNNDTVPDSVLSQMRPIVNAIAARDANGALAMLVELMTSASGDMTTWAPGVKQLIRLGI